MDKLKSISTKIITGYLSVVFFTFLVTALVFYPMLVGVLEKRAGIGLERQAWEIAHTISGGSLPSLENTTPLTILLLGRSVESDYLWLDRQGKVVFSSRPVRIPEGQASGQITKTLREKKTFDRNQANIFKNDHYISAEVPVGDGGTVLSFVSIDTLKYMYRETLLMIFGSLLVALTMALIIAFFLIRYLIKPLRQLEDYAGAVGERQFDIRLKVNSDDELAKLANAFNLMTDRLKNYDESMRRFFQNASHEMKTPLMSINGYAEGIRDGVFTGPALDDAIEIIHKESLRLKNVVENMIDITILDQSHTNYFLPNDLYYIMEQVQETVGGYALERKIQVVSGIRENTWVIGDWDHLHSMFVNLVSNGIRHARSLVEIQSLRIDNKAVIKVHDDGDGFTATDLARAFDYFYTGVKSGSGLGLTIARKIVSEHSGTIKLYNAAEGGAVVEIVLPAVVPKR